MTKKRTRKTRRTTKVKRQMKKLGWIAIGASVAVMLTAHGPAQGSTDSHAANSTTASNAFSTKSSATSGQSLNLSNGTDIKPGAYSEEEYVAQSFRATDATVQGYLIHSWSQLNGKFMTESDLQEIGTELKQELNIQNAKIMSNTDASENFYEVFGNWSGNTNVSVTLSSIRFPNTPSSTILIVRAHRVTGSLNGLNADTQLIQKAVASEHGTPQISTCIEGFTSARMMGVQAEELASKALSAVGAHRVEGVSSDLVTSISGYSSKAPGYIQTNGQKMNLQVAVHYDAYHHRTNVLVGTPIITETY